MNRKTQKQQIMELLSTGKPVSRAKLFNISFRFNSYIQELRFNGHQIACIKTGDKWFYTLMEGSHEQHATNIASKLPVA